MILELVAKFPLGVQRVVFDGDRADPQNRVKSDDVLRTVGKHEGNPVAAFHAEANQRGRHSGDLLPQLLIGGGGTKKLEGNL